MTTNSRQRAFETVINKARSINWNLSDLHLYSNGMLLQEHFHRLALWCEALNDFSYWPDSSDIMYMLGHREIDEYEIEKIRHELVAHASYLSYTDLRAWGRWFHWLIIQDYALETYPDLPDAFEPLIRMYERGGSYSAEHGFFYVGERGRQLLPPRSGYYVKNSFVSVFDDVSLNLLDSSGGES